MNRTKIISEMIDRDWSSRKKFAESIGIPPTTLQSILQRGVGKASIDNILKVCKGLGISIEKLEDMAEKSQTSSRVAELDAHYTTQRSNEEYKYDYYPEPVAAGILTSIEGVTENNIEKIAVPDILMGKHAGSDDIFFMKVNGDSMNKVFPDESLISVKRIEIHDLKNDDIVVFSDGNDFSVKRYYDDKESEEYVFGAESTDRRFRDYAVPYDNSENLIIHGKVVLYIVSTD